MRYNFTIHNHSETDILGLVPEFVNNWYAYGKYDPMFRLSHELRDHTFQKVQNGTIEEEMFAHGSLYYNSDGYDFHTLNGGLYSFKIFGNDLLQHLIDTEFSSIDSNSAEMPKKPNKEVMGEISSFVDETIAYLLDMKLEWLYFETYHVMTPKEYFDNIREGIVNNMYLGYMAAKRRYGKYDKWTMHRFWERLDEEIRAFFSFQELYKGMTGYIRFSYCGDIYIHLDEEEYKSIREDPCNCRGLLLPDSKSLTLANLRN